MRKNFCEYCAKTTNKQVRAEDGADYYCCRDCYKELTNRGHLTKVTEGSS